MTSHKKMTKIYYSTYLKNFDIFIKKFQFVKMKGEITSGCVIIDFRIEAKVAPQNQNKRRKRCEFHRKLLKAEVIDCVDKMEVSVRKHSIPIEILDDLASRFIINLPEPMRKDLIRICFQVFNFLLFWINSIKKMKSFSVGNCSLVLF